MTTVLPTESSPRERLSNIPETKTHNKGKYSNILISTISAVALGALTALGTFLMLATHSSLVPFAIIASIIFGVITSVITGLVSHFLLSKPNIV